MAVHMMALAAALHLSRSGAAAGSTTQMVASLAWPYLLRLCLSFRHQDLVSATRLFLFQLGRIITFDHDHDHQSPVDETANNRRRSRWVRAVRLVRGRLAEARRRVVVTSPHSDEEANLHVFSMISL